MKVALVTYAGSDIRTIRQHVQHVPDWVSEHIVLIQRKGEDASPSKVAIRVRVAGATVIEKDWPSEHEARNEAAALLSDYDWIIWLNSDEFLTEIDWDILGGFMVKPRGKVAYRTLKVYDYWKNGYVIKPAHVPGEVIITRPYIRFSSGRTVDVEPAMIGTTLISIHRFTWACTDTEMLHRFKKIKNLVVPNWRSDVWNSWYPKMADLHPIEPQKFKQAVPVELPHDLEMLNLWPELPPAGTDDVFDLIPGDVDIYGNLC